MSNFEHFAFLVPLWGVGTTYDFHLGLIGKRVVDFLSVLTELFSLVFRLSRDRKSAISLQHGPFDPKFQVEGVSPPSHFCTDSN